MLMWQRRMGKVATVTAATLAIALTACGGDDEGGETTAPTTADTTATTGATGATGEAGGGGTLTEQQFREFAEGYEWDECENPSFKNASAGGFGGDPEGKGIYYA